MTATLDDLTSQTVVIVAGKGGVGKTTVTAVLANAAARRGKRVLAVDLDGKPDLARLADGVETITITPGEALEEYLKDHGFGRAASRLLRSGVIDLVATASPGINEVVMLGKVKQLARSGRYDLIVVDGPAAGHAVTMLTSAHGLLEVATSGPVHHQAVEVRDLLTDHEMCSVVMVTLPETTPVTEAVEAAFHVEDLAGVALAGVVVNQSWPTAGNETVDSSALARFTTGRLEVQHDALGRLAAELPLPRLHLPMIATAGLDAADVERVSAWLADGGTLDDGSWAWDRPVTGSSEATPRNADRADPDSCDGEGLGAVVDSHDVVLCVGPGGVGKTTTSAALGLAAARRGRRVVVVTIDPARRLADALGMPGGLTDSPTKLDVTIAENDTDDDTDDDRADGELWAMMLDPKAMMRRLIQRYAADEQQVERIVSNRIFRHLTENLGGTQEYMASEALYELHNDDRFDLVIVDTPPSRQTLNLLESPGVLTRFLSHRLFRLLMLPTRTSMKVVGDATQLALRQVGRVVGTDVLADAAAFFQSFAGMDEGFRARAEAVDEVLRADSTGFVVVTSPNEDTIAEALWFTGRLSQLSASVEATVVNRVMPRFDEEGSSDVGRLVVAIAEAQRAALVPLRQLSAAVDVPLMPTDVHDTDILNIIADGLV